MLLFSLVLRGRFDEPAQPAVLETPAPSARRAAPGSPRRSALALGAPLLFFSDGGVTLVLGVVLLLVGLAAGGAYLVAQASLGDR